MASAQTSRSAAARPRLKHPVIDSDGHSFEPQPELLDCLKDVAGADVVKRFLAEEGGTPSNMRGWFTMSPQERAQRRIPQPWWGQLPAKRTLDLATTLIPKLLYERLDEIGINFTVLYNSVITPNIIDDEVRQAACFALNKYRAETFRDYSDRIAPAAEIPMNTPQEAIAELEHAVKELGMKAVMFPGFIQRPIPADADKFPKVFWYDTFGLDSEYDYDPVWAKCIELKVAATFHQHGIGFGTRTSTSNFIYNKLGDLAESMEAVGKSLFLGGVTRRFPQLRFAFHEGGVAWGCLLYAGIVGLWEKRNVKAVEIYNPALIDRRMLSDLLRSHGGFPPDRAARILESLTGGGSAAMPVASVGYEKGPIDDFARCAIQRGEDIRELFVSPFYFGCESDDPMTALAFDTKKNPYGARINAIYASDIGHWDVPDQRYVVGEAYEMVERGLISEDDFRDFVFANPVKLWAGMNPDFFKGTVVEQQAKKILSEK